MKILKQLFTILLFSIFITIVFSSTIYGTFIKVTDENLKTSINNYVASDKNTNNYQITIENKQIKIKSDNKDIILKYDLSNKPTFTYEAEIKQGMSYNDFQNETNNSTITMLGYMSVANIQGIDYEDSLSYFLMTLLTSAFSNLSDSNSNNSYIIVDDENLEDGVTINKDSTDNKTIYTSEFRNRVIEYTNSLYSEKQTFKDDLNTFELTTEKKDMTSTSGKIVTTLTINPDADFSQLQNFENKASDSIMDKNITEENADYLIKLKVGQKCKFESTESIIGYSTFGSGIEWSEDKSTITATNVGKVNGYIYIGDNQSKKTLYIIIEENLEKKELEPITINLNSLTDTISTTTDNTSDEEKLKALEEQLKAQEEKTQQTLQQTNNTTNNVANITVMPKTGITQNPILSFIYIILFTAIIGILILLLTKNNNKQ